MQSETPNCHRNADKAKAILHGGLTSGKEAEEEDEEEEEEGEEEEEEGEEEKEATLNG